MTITNPNDIKIRISDLKISIPLQDDTGEPIGFVYAEPLADDVMERFGYRLLRFYNKIKSDGMDEGLAFLEALSIYRELFYTDESDDPSARALKTEAFKKDPLLNEMKRNLTFLIFNDKKLYHAIDALPAELQTRQLNKTVMGGLLYFTCALNYMLIQMGSAQRQKMIVDNSPFTLLSASALVDWLNKSLSNATSKENHPVA